MMNRRTFFDMLTSGSTFRTSAADVALMSVERPPALASGLEPYTQVLDRAKAYHLLRRLTFAPTPELTTQIIGKTAAEAVTLLLGTGTEADPPSPGTWVDSATENPLGQDQIRYFQILGIWDANYAKLQDWWIEQMRAETLPAREKLTLFWHGHFVSEYDFDETFNIPQILYRQNQKLRANRLGDFKVFAEEITLDPAMLKYLGGILNTKYDAVKKTTPNENYARELMELFTVGIGWYTEGDVKEAARVLTGWRAAQYSDEPAPNGIYNTYFSPTAHDIGAKQVLGQTIAARDDNSNTEALVRREEVRRLVEIIFEQRPDAVAKFIAKKVYQFFVYSNPGGNDQAVIDAMASTFKQNNFVLKPMISALLSSAHFFDDANCGIQIKTPAEFAIGLARQLGKPLVSGRDTMNTLEQALFNPPNVAGWEAYRRWISTKTYPIRRTWSFQLIATMTDADFLNLLKKFPNYDDVDKVTKELELYFLPKGVSADRHTNYVNTLLQGAKTYEWPALISDAGAVGSRMKALINAFAKAPDFQLC